jgi:hypothetical protein
MPMGASGWDRYALRASSRAGWTTMITKRSSAGSAGATCEKKLAILQGDERMPKVNFADVPRSIPRHSHVPWCLLSTDALKSVNSDDESPIGDVTELELFAFFAAFAGDACLTGGALAMGALKGVTGEAGT